MLDASAAQIIALRHYRTLWYGQLWADVSAAWQTEYDIVSAGAFSPLQILSVAMEGFTPAGRNNFEQGVRVAALQLFRAEQDVDYATAVFAPSSVLTAPRMIVPDYTHARPV